MFLPDLDSANARRRAIATRYSTLITQPNIALPAVRGEEYVAHLYVIRSPQRDQLREHLRSHDIASDIHYPIPDHRQPVLRERYAETSLPNTDRLASEILTLPCYPEMTDEQVDQVIAAVNNW